VDVELTKMPLLSLTYYRGIKLSDKKRSCVITKIVVYLTSLCVIWAFFGMSGPV
jgi:hypothetical protein